MRRAMLERLETADRRAELLALLQIADRQIHRAAADAEQFGRRAGAPRREQPLERPRARIDFADHRIGIDLDTKIGRPSGRARVCRYVSISLVAVYIKKNK